MLGQFLLRGSGTRLGLLSEITLWQSQRLFLTSLVSEAAAASLLEGQASTELKLKRPSFEDGLWAPCGW